MIKISDTAYIYRILSIDNGTTTMGIVVSDLDLRTGKIEVVYAETCNATVSSRRYQSIIEHMGDRFARYRTLALNLREVLDEYDVDIVIAEGAYSHLNLETFAILREALAVIRETIIEYDDRLELIVVPPTKVKKAVKAESYQGKTAMRQAVLALRHVTYLNGINPELLDEHCIDAVGVAEYLAIQTLNEVHRRK